MNYKIKYLVAIDFLCHNFEVKETVVTEPVLIAMLSNTYYIIQEMKITGENR